MYIQFLVMLLGSLAAALIFESELRKLAPAPVPVPVENDETE